MSINKAMKITQAKKSFKFFAESDMIDQSIYVTDETPDGIVIKDVHMGWVDAIEQEGISKLALTAFTGSGKCVTGDTLVPMADGSWKKITDIHEGEKVVSFNEETFSLEPAEVSNFYKNGIKPVYKITTRNGREVKVTKNHPFYTADGWKSIEDGLDEDDIVAQPSKIPSPNKDSISYEEAALLGIIIAEGGLTQESVKISLGEEKLVEKTEGLLHKWDAELVKISDNRVDYRIQNIEGRKGKTNLVKKYLDSQDLMGKSSKSKRVPDSIMNASEQTKKVFLSWLWSGDGYVSKPVSNYSVSLCLANKKLLHDIQKILLSLGIKSRINYKKSKIDDKEYDAWRLSIESTKSVLKIQEFLDIPLDRKQKRLDKIISYLEDVVTNTNIDLVPPKFVKEELENMDMSQRELSNKTGISEASISLYKNGLRAPSKESFHKLAEETSIDEKHGSEEICWEKIKDIEYLGEEETYDITIPKNHSFIAEGYITHNTTILGVLYPLWRIFFRGDDILIVSNNIKKSRAILAEIKQHIENSEWLNGLKPENPKNWNKDHMKCTNGSNVYVRPFNENAKGVHVDYAIVDEAAELGEIETYRKAIKTRVNKKNGDICLISTPVHENDVMAQLSEGVRPPLCPYCYEEVVQEEDKSFCDNEGCDYFEEEVDELFNPKISEMGYWNEKFKIMDEDGEPNFPEAFDKQDIARLKREDPVAFQREYMCEYTTIGGDLFDPNDVVSCYDSDEGFETQPREGCSYVMGVDFAVSKQGDYSVYTVLESDPEREEKAVVRYIERIQGMRLDDQEERIKDLHDIFDFDKIVVDATNFGEPTFRSLRDAGLPVEGQSFEPAARNPLLIGLRKAFENQELVIPRDEVGRTRKLTDKLHKELMAFGVSETSNGSVTYKSTGKHDDLPISLAMANKAVKNKKPVLSMVAY